MHTHFIFWDQWLKEILSCHLWESIEIDVLFYGLIEENSTSRI